MLDAVEVMSGLSLPAAELVRFQQSPGVPLRWWQNNTDVLNAFLERHSGSKCTGLILQSDTDYRLAPEVIEKAKIAHLSIAKEIGVDEMLEIVEVLPDLVKLVVLSLAFRRMPAYVENYDSSAQGSGPQTPKTRIPKSNALMQQRTSVRVTYGSQKSKAPSVSCSVVQRADTPEKRHLPAEDRGDGRSDDNGDGDDTVNSTEDTQAIHSAKKRLVQTSLFLGSQLRAVKRPPETNLGSGTKQPLQGVFPELGLPNKTQTSAGKLGAGDNWTVPKRKASQILNHHGRASSLAAAHGDTPCKREQTFLDFGQKPLGLELCQICGMAYQRGKEEDEDLHTRFHRSWQQKQARLLSWDVESMTAENKSQIEFVPYRKNCGNKSKARIGKQQPQSMAAIVFVYPQVCSKREVVRALAIINVANEHLGAVKLSCKDLEHSQRKILLYISPDGRVEGCILAEAIQSARRIVVEEETQLVDSAVRLLEDEEPATCGISRIWVPSTARRCGIASQMIDALCKRFAYGCELSRDMLAFTQPTSEGRALAEASFGRRDFLVYAED
ncbi:hypothetical protein GGI11_007428 [Coemansia sp. RSA 2049]|nr:hypothetical protein GGI11_007428 [Coemansia sp. RSA 2049]